MKIGVPTEVKADEYRVALTPAGVRELVDHGHHVLIQAGAGEGSGISDADFEAQGARIVADDQAVFGEAELIIKVKEPQPAEVKLLQPHHTLFTFLHLAPASELTKGLCKSGATAIAYETVEDAHGRLPLLAPMSEVAGKIATQAGAFMLETPFGGRGILLGGVPGVASAKVMIIGGGVVGMNAATIAIGMQADVDIFDRNINRLRDLDITFGRQADTCYASTLDIEQSLPEVDLVIGSVLVHGARSPYVITRDQLKLMRPGAVLVDVSIDQGGCFETSRPTTHSDPTFEVDGVPQGAELVSSICVALGVEASGVIAHRVVDVGHRYALGDDVGCGDVVHPLDAHVGHLQRDARGPARHVDAGSPRDFIM